MTKINTHYLLLVSVYFLYLPNICFAPTCSSQEEQTCKEDKINKYSKEANTKYQEYLQLIKEAKNAYKPCDITKCGCHSQVIANDLQIFKKDGISKQLIQDVISKATKYQVIDHRLYRDKSCMFPARCAGIEHFITDLLPKLPNMELVVNTRDWPQVNKGYGIFGPIFSFSKTSEYHDIMYPAWSFWTGGPAISLYPRGIGRWDIHRKRLGKLGNETLWHKKICKGFFRGSRTSSERDPLVLLSRENPELVDAQYTKNQGWKSDADTLHAPPAEEVSFEEHCKYKYLFNFRGVAASFRFKHILLCKSLVFHVGDDWLEFFYPALKPWIHYIPVDASASKQEIQELIEFVIDHDDIAREIAENGYNMIWNNLRLDDVSCYWSKLFKSYAKLLNYEPVLDTTLIEIKEN